MQTDRKTKRRGADSKRQKQKRKQRVLTHGVSSLAQSIADAAVIKNENLFFLAQPNGEVPLSDGHGLGLYYHDCRYLCGYVVKLAGIPLTPLTATVTEGFAAVFELTNQETKISRHRTIPRDTIGVRWQRLARQREPGSARDHHFAKLWT
jgi:hypothetical protein